MSNRLQCDWGLRRSYISSRQAKACCFCSASSADATTFVFVILLLQLQYTLLQKRVYRVYYKGSVQCTVQSSVKAATRKEVTP